MVPDLPVEEMERRKRLYEAAPALLEALEQAVAYLSHDHQAEFVGRDALLEQARAAIAQARGKEQS